MEQPELEKKLNRIIQLLERIDRNCKKTADNSGDWF